jgi:hypothetical protein
MEQVQVPVQAYTQSTLLPADDSDVVGCKSASLSHPAWFVGEGAIGIEIRGLDCWGCTWAQYEGILWALTRV